jgi:hypothetical protein
LEDAIALVSSFFRDAKMVPVISPKGVKGVEDPAGVGSSELVGVEWIETHHGSGSSRVPVRHYMLAASTLLVSDGSIFDRLGMADPSDGGLRPHDWLVAIESGAFDLAPAWQAVLDGRRSFDRAYVTVQCADMLPGDYAKVAGAYFLARSGITREVVLCGWGAENVLSDGDRRLLLPVLWSRGLQLLGVPCTALDDFSCVRETLVR